MGEKWSGRREGKMRENVRKKKMGWKKIEEGKKVIWARVEERMEGKKREEREWWEIIAEGEKIEREWNGVNSMQKNVK